MATWVPNWGCSLSLVLFEHLRRLVGVCHHVLRFERKIKKGGKRWHAKRPEPVAKKGRQ